MTNKTENKLPDYVGYNVKNYGEDQSNWIRVGAAWTHQDNGGINIVLDSIPLDGKLTLRKPKQSS